jgi:hypothetical protein
VRLDHAAQLIIKLVIVSAGLAQKFIPFGLR